MSLSPSAYGELFDRDPDALVVVDPETSRVRDCNRRYCELRGEDRDDVVGRTFAAPEPVDGSADEPFLSRLRDADGSLPCRLRTGGSVVRLDARAAAVEDLLLVRLAERVTVDGRPTPDQRLRAMDEAPIGITLSDPDREDNPLVYVNEGFERLTGYDEEEVVGRNCRFLQGPDTDPEPVAELRRAIDAAEPVTVELRNYRADGSSFWNRVTVAPVRDGGEVCNFVGFQRDVTDLERYRRELELSRDLLETVPSGVFRTDPAPDGTFEYANPALVDLLGAESAAQLREHRVADFYADPSVREALIASLRETDAAHVQREVRLETLDDRTVDVLLTASTSTDETGAERVHKVVQDITDRKERERALERYERLVDDLPIGVFQTTPGPDGTFTLLNDAMVELFDAASREELRERSVSELYVDSTERERLSDRLLERGAIREREVRLRTLDGDELWGAVTAIARDVGGRTVFDGVIQDVTERKRYQQRLESQRDDLTVLNEMLRHDIRNDLQLVVAYADLLADHADGEGAEHVETIRESAVHAVELTRTARDMADVMLSAGDDCRPVDLRTALEGELDDVRAEYPDAAITVTDAIPAVPVRANDMLDSVFRNLLTNAIQHNDRDLPEVEVSVTERDDDVVVRVADDGPGVPDAQKSAIFGKGKKGLESEGSGIGLYLVETLVDAYGGDVWVEDNEPRGAVFGVELPKAE